jgi:hypothetical protein
MDDTHVLKAPEYENDADPPVLASYQDAQQQQQMLNYTPSIPLCNPDCTE